MSNIEMEKLIKIVITTDEFWHVNYYMGSMKKAPHGGVFNINIPNYYINYMPKNLFNIFRDGKIIDVLEFLSVVLDEAVKVIEKYDFNINEMASLIFKDSDNWYTTFRLLKPKEEYKEINKTVPLIWKVIDGNLEIENYFNLDRKIVEYAFICWIIDNNFINISGLPEIKKHEKLLHNHNKYGLGKLENVEYKRQGFVYQEKYYLYNVFLDTSILEPLDKVPGTIKVIVDEIKDVNFQMRLDEELAIKKEKAISTATSDSQVFRGIKLDIIDIDKLVYTKEIIVHYNPETLNKLVMIIKHDIEDGEQFYHIEIEELWNCDCIEDDIIITNFIHSKYYPKRKVFNHIDFSVNQYDCETYRLKYLDKYNITGVPIDKYCDTHYKVWCAEADEITIETWNKLVEITLDKPFRELFVEIIEG